MANYRYDPMLCMNVPVKGTRAQDATYQKGDFKGNTVKEVMAQNKYMQPDAVYYNGKRVDEKEVLNKPVSHIEVTSGVIYYYVKDAKAKDEDVITLKDYVPDDYSGNEVKRILSGFGFRSVRVDGEQITVTGNKKAILKAYQNGWLEDAVMANKSRIERMKDVEPTELMNKGKCPEGMTCDATDALTWNVAITIDYEDPDGEKGRKVAYGPISNVFTQAQKLVDTLQGHDCTIMAAKFGR